MNPHPQRLPPVDEDLMARALTLAERSNWESNATAAGALREEALKLWAAAHQVRRDTMYRRGRQ